MGVKGKISLVLVPLLLANAVHVAAQPARAIGKVITANGAVTARDASGAIRTLARKGDIFEQDTIIVGADGYTQIRMVDSAMIEFKPNTEFAFNTYNFDGNPETADQALMSMVKGGFRTISGTVGDDDKDDYRVDTPYASIGIRGTTHEAVIEGGLLYTGVYTGGTTISNNQGSVDTGFDAEYDFAVTEPGQAPRGLLEEPPVLGNFQIAQGLALEEGNDDAAADNNANANNANAGNGNGNDGNANAANNNAANNNAAPATNAAQPAAAVARHLLRHSRLNGKSRLNV